MENVSYKQLRDFVCEHHGFGGNDFEDHPEIMENYTKIMNEIRSFDGERVTLTYRSASDWIKTSGEMTGKIKTEGEKIKFYEGKKRTRFRYLDAGLFEGWFATIIPLTIERA